MVRAPRRLETPTLAMLALTYIAWALGTVALWPFSPLLALIVTTLAVAQYSSLQHEVLHGHPFRNQALNEALVFPGLTLFVPYQRFRDTHLAHHHDPNLTDPYDDPESNYLDPAVWARTPRPVQRLLRLNSTLLGRILIGPAISTWYFGKADLAVIRDGNGAIAMAWVWHGVGVALVLIWLAAFGTMPLWAYVVAAYLGYGLLKIRTFLEHRAHTAARARSVVVESRGPFSVLFLNNNFHSVHHMHPAVPWYDLPGLYAANRDHYLRRNDGYLFASYTEIFRRYLLRAKDTVPHPFYPMNRTGTDHDADL